MSVLTSASTEVEQLNRVSGQAINNENIIFATADGVVESTNSGWRFTPADELDEIATAIAGPYETPTMPGVPMRRSEELYNAFAAASDADIVTENKTAYFFGIDSVSLQYKVPDATSGIVFHSIPLGRCSYVQLSADIALNDKSSVELYVIDGTKETPILPIENDRVINEKLFFNLPTRFTVDTKRDIEVKKDGQVIKRTIEGLDSLDLQSGLYTISYTPLNAHNYFPDNETISIKAIQRLYDPNAEPPYIRNLLVHKYGGGLTWIE
jgi:hypothetical protein